MKPKPQKGDSKRKGGDTADLFLESKRVRWGKVNGEAVPPPLPEKLRRKREANEKNEKDEKKTASLDPKRLLQASSGLAPPPAIPKEVKQKASATVGAKSGSVKGGGMKTAEFMCAWRGVSVFEWLSEWVEVVKHYFQEMPFSWHKVVLDGVLLLGILGGVDYGVSESFGFGGVTPCPYFLVPLWLGCRYGFLSGFFGGGVTGVMIMAFQLWEGRMGLPDYFSDNWYFILSFLVVGGISGEVQSFFYRKLREKSVLLENVNQQLYQLREEVDSLRQGRDELARVLHAMNADVKQVVFDPRRLFQCRGDELYSGVLSLLESKVHVQSGAFYVCEAGGEKKRFKRVAWQGDDESRYPESLGQGESEAVRRCVQTGRAVVMEKMWTSHFKNPTDYLVAMPVVSDKELIAVLVIGQLPFTALNQRSVHTVGIVCQWMVKIMRQGREGGGECRYMGDGRNRIYTQEYFMSGMHLAHETHRYLQISSSIVLFYCPQGKPEDQSRLEKKLGRVLRSGDVPSRLDGEVPNLALFLPLTGPSGGHLCCQRILKYLAEDGTFDLSIRAEVLGVGGGGSLMALEQKLKQLVQG